MPPRTKKTAESPNNVTSLDRVHFNLDEWEDPTAIKEKFAFTVGGKRLELIDPRDIDWQDLRLVSQNNDPAMFFEFCFTEEDKDFFLKQRVTGRKMNKLVELYLRHYKIEMPAGNSIASSI